MQRSTLRDTLKSWVNSGDSISSIGATLLGRPDILLLDCVFIVYNLYNIYRYIDIQLKQVFSTISLQIEILRNQGWQVLSMW